MQTFKRVLTLTLISTLFLTSCSNNNNFEDLEKVYPVKRPKYSDLETSKKDWHQAVEDETTPPSIEPAPPKDFPTLEVYDFIQPGKKLLSKEFEQRQKDILEKEYYIDTKYGISLYKPKKWESTVDTIQGWTDDQTGKQIVSYGSIARLDYGFCEYNYTSSYGITSKRKAEKGIVGIRGRNQISLKNALLQEINIIKDILNNDDYSFKLPIQEFEISEAKSLRTRIEFTNINPSNKCEGTKQVWDIITTKSYYNREVAVIVIQRWSDIENPVKDNQTEDFIARIKKADIQLKKRK